MPPGQSVDAMPPADPHRCPNVILRIAVRLNLVQAPHLLGAQAFTLLFHHTALLAPAVVQSDFISFRHHTYEMPKGVKSVQLKECGPRFEMKLYQVGLGDMDAGTSL